MVIVIGIGHMDGIHIEAAYLVAAQGPVGGIGVAGGGGLHIGRAGGYASRQQGGGQQEGEQSLKDSFHGCNRSFLLLHFYQLALSGRISLSYRVSVQVCPASQLE